MKVNFYNEPVRSFTQLILKKNLFVKLLRRNDIVKKKFGGEEINVFVNDTPASNYSARHGAPTKIEINEYLCSRLTLEEFKIGIIYHELIHAEVDRAYPYNMKNCVCDVRGKKCSLEFSLNCEHEGHWLRISKEVDAKLPPNGPKTDDDWKCEGFSVGSNRKIPNLEPPEPLVNRTSNLPNLFLDFKTEP